MVTRGRPPRTRRNVRAMCQTRNARGDRLAHRRRQILVRNGDVLSREQALRDDLYDCVCEGHGEWRSARASGKSIPFCACEIGATVAFSSSSGVAADESIAARARQVRRLAMDLVPGDAEAGAVEDDTVVRANTESHEAARGL